MFSKTTALFPVLIGMDFLLRCGNTANSRPICVILAGFPYSPLPGWIMSGPSPSSPRSRHINMVRDYLASAGFDSAVISGDEFEFTQRGSVRVSTLHSSKGIDFPVIRFSRIWSPVLKSCRIRPPWKRSPFTYVKIVVCSIILKMELKYFSESIRR